MHKAVAVAIGLAFITAAGCSSDKDDTTAAPAAASSAPAAAAAAASSAPGSATAAPASASPASPTPTPSAATSEPATASSSEPAADAAIGIVVTAGQVATKDKIAKVKIGSTVTLLVSSDVADEIHVHGYDVMKDVTANAPATLTFKADQPGRFEVEFEKAGLRLLMLQVS